MNKKPNNFNLILRNFSKQSQKRKKSSKKNKKEDSGSRIRSRERLENRTIECNSAINTYQKDQSPLSFFCHDKVNFEEDDNLLQYMQDSIMLNGHISNIEKNLKQMNEAISQDGKVQQTDYDKLQYFLKSLAEIAELQPSSKHLFTMIKEGVEDCFQRLVSRENFKNILLRESVNKIQQEMKNETVNDKPIAGQNLETRELIGEIKKVDSNYKQLKNQFSQCEADHKKYLEQIQWLKDREEDIINRLDLDEIDLVTERLWIYGVAERKTAEKKPLKTYPKIPKLNFEEVYRMQAKDQEEDYEEEEEETEEDNYSSKKFFKDGKVLASDDSHERLEKLKKRKEQVIALLNQTYDNE